MSEENSREEPGQEAQCTVENSHMKLRTILLLVVLAAAASIYDVFGGPLSRVIVGAVILAWLVFWGAVWRQICSYARSRKDNRIPIKIMIVTAAGVFGLGLWIFGTVAKMWVPTFARQLESLATAGWLGSLVCLWLATSQRRRRRNGGTQAVASWPERQPANSALIRWQQVHRYRRISKRLAAATRGWAVVVLIGVAMCYLGLTVFPSLEHSGLPSLTSIGSTVGISGFVGALAGLVVAAALDQKARSIERRLTDTEDQDAYT